MVEKSETLVMFAPTREDLPNRITAYYGSKNRTTTKEIEQEKQEKKDI
jgi:hypothetical protein